MEETTTTEEVVPTHIGAPVGVQGGIPIDEFGNAIPYAEPEAVPGETTPEAVVTTIEAPTETAPQAEPVVAPSSNTDTSNNDLIEWAKKKGIDPSDPIKVLELARSQDRASLKAHQEKSELKGLLDSLSAPKPAPVAPVYDPYDPYSDPATTYPQQPQPQAAPAGRTIDPTIAFLQLRVDHPDYAPGTQLDSEISKIVGQDPSFWVNNLEYAYQIAKTNVNQADVSSLVEAARREERDNLARQSKLSQPANHAVTSKVSSGSQLSDAAIASMSTEEYQKRLPEINAWLASN